MLLTNDIKRAIAKASHMTLDFQPAPDIEGSWERDRKVVAIWLTTGSASAKDQTRITFEGFRGWIHSGYRDEMVTERTEYGTHRRHSREDSNIYQPESGRWMELHSNQDWTLQSIFRVIPTGSALTFRMMLDHHTYPALAEKGVHVDVLVVEAQPPTRKGGKQAKALQFTIATPTSFHDKNRFGNW